MFEKSIQAVKNNLIKSITIIVTIFSLIGVVWAIEDRYASKEIVTAGMSNLQEQQEAFQNQQRAFQKQQEISIQQQKINYLRSRMEFYQQMLEQVRYDRSIVISNIQQQPNNMYLMEKKNELDRREKIIQEKIQQVMNEMGNIQ